MQSSLLSGPATTRLVRAIGGAGGMVQVPGPVRAVSGSQTITRRTRDLVRNDWVAAAVVRIYAATLIGQGIIARLNTTKKSQKQRIDGKWNSWVSYADAVLNLFGL